MIDSGLLKALNVSRETMGRLELFEGVIRKWNPRINLVSRSSLEHLWTRHIADSVQIFRCAPSALPLGGYRQRRRISRPYRCFDGCRGSAGHGSDPH